MTKTSEERVPVTIRIRRSVYDAAGIAAKIRKMTVGEWMEEQIIPAIPQAFRKEIVK